jgi:capsule polysaccharide modification protein KpsS
MSGNGSDKQKDKEVVFFIDNQQVKTEQGKATVRELLKDFAEEDPAKTTLVLKHGNETHKYTDLDEIVELKNGMHFVVYHNEPTPVS